MANEEILQTCFLGGADSFHRDLYSWSQLSKRKKNQLGEGKEDGGKEWRENMEETV